MKSKVLFLIAFFVSFSLFSQQLKQEKPLSVDLAIFLDREQEFRQIVLENKEYDQVTVVRALVISLIKNPIPFIATTSLIAAIMKTNVGKSFLEQVLSDALLYKSKTDDFIVIIPQRYFEDKYAELQTLGFKESEIVKALGFNEGAMVSISAADAITTLENIAKNYTNLVKANKSLPEISVNNLEQLLTPSIPSKTDKVILMPIKKRIFLLGHGGYLGNVGYIAGLPVKNYQSLLEYFNTINVDLFYVVSCYAGGELRDAAFEKDKELSAQIKPNYFVIIGSTTDTAAIRVDWNLKKFFEKAGEFLDTGKIKNCNEPFKCIIQALAPTRLENIPSVRFPGSIHYFKAVDADNNLLIITYVKTTAQAYEGSPFIVEPKNRIDKTAILLYPVDSKVPIEIKQKTIPAIISMIPGNAFHIIPKLKFNGSMDDLINNAFFPFDITSEKIFLIKTLEIDNDKITKITNLKTGKIQLNNVMIKKEAGYGKRVLLEFDFDNKFYTKIIPHFLLTYLPIEKVDESSKKYSTIAKSINDITMEQNVLSVQENLEELKKKAIDEFTGEPETVKKMEKAIPFTQQK